VQRRRPGAAAPALGRPRRQPAPVPGRHPARELRGLVAAYLAAHPGEELGPHAIGRAIGGRSSGAVANALDRPVALGQAWLAREAPRRYQHATPALARVPAGTTAGSS
jgi:hypothetical protein